jgi:hypothetical protein
MMKQKDWFHFFDTVQSRRLRSRWRGEDPVAVVPVVAVVFGVGTTVVPVVVFPVPVVVVVVVVVPKFE